jgi:spoIIIJ-associated protein
MQAVDSATQILDTILGHLGYNATIDPQDTPDGPCLQISSSESSAICGKDGERLDDLQYLVNRILHRHAPKAPRVRVDCAHFREMQQDKMADEVAHIVQRVKTTGKPQEMRPLNGYYRRMVYTILAEDGSIMAHSPEGDDRLKRITISTKNAGQPDL